MKHRSYTDQIVTGLYPIVRRVRRPLVSNQPAAASTPQPEAPAKVENASAVPVVVSTTGQTGRSSTSLTGEQGEAGPNTNSQPPTPNIEGEVSSTTTTSPRTSTIKNPEERHARKAKEA